MSFDTPEDNAKFAEKFSFAFPILSDADKSIAIAYGAAPDAGAKYANRITVVIGKDGRVERIYGKVDPKTHADTVLQDSAASSGTR